MLEFGHQYVRVLRNHARWNRRPERRWNSPRHGPRHNCRRWARCSRPTCCFSRIGPGSRARSAAPATRHGASRPSMRWAGRGMKERGRQQDADAKRDHRQHHHHRQQRGLCRDRRWTAGAAAAGRGGWLSGQPHRLCGRRHDGRQGRRHRAVLPLHRRRHYGANPGERIRRRLHHRRHLHLEISRPQPGVVFGADHRIHGQHARHRHRDRPAAQHGSHRRVAAWRLERHHRLAAMRDLPRGADRLRPRPDDLDEPHRRLPGLHAHL